MSWSHLDAAANLEGLPPAAKSVLMHVAQPACEACGIAWPGVPWLERKSGLGKTAIRAALEWLVKAGHLKIYAYPQGGRGMSTEYIVLPQLTELSTTPCGECRSRMKRHRLAVGIDQSVTPKPTARRWVSAKPTAQTTQNPPRGGDQSFIESESFTRTSGPSPSARGSATPPPSEPPPPTNAQESYQAVLRLVDAVGDALGPPSLRTGNGDPLSAATAPATETPQADGHDDGLEAVVEVEETDDG